MRKQKFRKQYRRFKKLYKIKPKKARIFHEYYSLLNEEVLNRIAIQITDHYAYRGLESKKWYNRKKRRGQI